MFNITTCHQNFLFGQEKIGQHYSNEFNTWQANAIIDLSIYNYASISKVLNKRYCFNYILLSKCISFQDIVFNVENHAIETLNA